MTQSIYPSDVNLIRARLKSRSLVLVGLMGCGKTSVGKRLAARLGLSFVDSDHEIENASGLTVPEIFERHGESYFRSGEMRVISRLLDKGPQVLATGGGAYMNVETQQNCHEKGLTLWLNTDLPLLMKRVLRRHDRPLLKTENPEATMQNLMNIRYPTYARSDVTVISRDVPHEVMVEEAVKKIKSYYGIERA